MAESEKKQSSSGILTVVLIVVGVLILLTIVSILRKQKTQEPVVPEVTPSEKTAAPEEPKAAQPEETKPVEITPQETPPPAAPPAAAEKPAEVPTATLQEIARTADTWEPAYMSWFGKTAPGFRLTDITGKSHTLYDYRGKNVMIVLWGTWCPPCREEIPHLIALQKLLADKLAIIAISIEKPDVVKRFVTQNGRINYTVIAADESAVPAPYSEITGFPSAFYIDPDGKIKFAALGAMTLGTMRAIVTAQN